jgi:hypothetical protein
MTKHCPLTYSWNRALRRYLTRYSHSHENVKSNLVVLSLSVRNKDISPISMTFPLCLLFYFIQNLSFCTNNHWYFSFVIYICMTFYNFRAWGEGVLTLRREHMASEPKNVYRWPRGNEFSHCTYCVLLDIIYKIVRPPYVPIILVCDVGSTSEPSNRFF